jgi:hypothetical protein
MRIREPAFLRVCREASDIHRRSSMSTESRFELWGGAPFRDNRYYQPLVSWPASARSFTPEEKL